jgi:hypothetical protein
VLLYGNTSPASLACLRSPNFVQSASFAAIVRHHLSRNPHDRRNPFPTVRVRNSVRRGSLLLLVAVLGGCTSDQVPDASRAPAEQQLAVTKAVDHAVDNLKLEIAPRTKVFVDSSYVDTEDKGIVLPKYTIGAVRDLLLRAGANLVPERNEANLVAELRTGAQAVNRKNFLVGVPSFSLPIPMTGPLSTPEVALFKRDTQKGVSKIALTLYNAKTGALVDSTGASYGDSRLIRYQALLVFNWIDEDVAPEHIRQPSGDIEAHASSDRHSNTQSARREP